MNSRKQMTRVYSAVSPLDSTSSMEQDYKDEVFHAPVLPPAINFRDVSELSPEKLRRNSVYRCSEIFTMDHLQQLKIKTLIDMRKLPPEETHPVYVQLQNTVESDAEMSPRVCHFEMITRPVKLGIVTRMPWTVKCKLAKCLMSRQKPETLMSGALSDPDVFGFEKFYKLLVDKATDVIADILRLFADEQNYPILFHCTHGKDRTGILCCLLCLLTGVSREVICEDYAQSGKNLMEAKISYKLPIPDYLLTDSVIIAPKSAMAGLIDYIDFKYNGIEGYLAFIGLTMNESEAIKQNLQTM